MQQDVRAAVQVIVVADTADRIEVLHSFGDRLDLTVLRTGGGAGGGAARNLGVGSAAGGFVAYLDDDDCWDPGKLRIQLAAAKVAALQGSWPIITSRVRQRAATGGRPVSGIPAKIYDGTGDPSDYLFRGRRPGSRRASIFPSSVLVDVRLAREVLWDPNLPRHQDWDWIIRATRCPAATMTQLPDELVTVYLGTAGSISAKPDWASSLRWANATLREAGSRTYVDFLTAQTLRYALQARDRRGVLATLNEIRAARAIPSLGPALTGAAGVLSRAHLQELMGWVR